MSLSGCLIFRDMRPMGNAFKPLYSKMKNIMQHCGLIEFLKTVTFMVFYHRLPHTVRKMISIFLSAFFSFACIEEQRRAGSKSGLCVFQVIWSSFFFFSFSICCFVLFFCCCCCFVFLFCFRLFVSNLSSSSELNTHQTLGQL